MNWPLSKIYDYMAFFMLENQGQNKKSKSPMSFEQICRELEREGVDLKDG